MQETNIFNTVKENITNPTFFGRRDTSITAAIIIDAYFKLRYACAFLEFQYSQLGEEKAASVSIEKRKMWKVSYTLLRKTYNILFPMGGGSKEQLYVTHLWNKGGLIGAAFARKTKAGGILFAQFH